MTSVAPLTFTVHPDKPPDLPSLWRKCEENRDFKEVSLTIRGTVSPQDSELFDSWCKYFGYQVQSLEIKSRVTIDRIIDPTAFDHLTAFIAVHEFNSPISRSFLAYLSRFSPALQRLAVRCSYKALVTIGSFRSLKHLAISLVVPWYLDASELDAWTEHHVSPVLTEQFNRIAPHLESFALFAPRVRIPWSLMDLTRLTELDVETGLFRQLLSLTHAKELQRLTYCYYGSEFCVGEIDDWEVLMESLLKLSTARLRIPYDFKDRVEVVNWIATFVEDWPQTTFLIDDGWDEAVVTDADAIAAAERTIVFQSGGKPSRPSDGFSVAVLRSENLLVKLPVQDRRHFAHFKTVPW